MCEIRQAVRRLYENNNEQRWKWNGDKTSHNESYRNGVTDKVKRERTFERMENKAMR